MAVGGRAQDANSGSITGEVIETWNNTPLPNVIVTVRGTTLATKTDREGSFIIKNVPAGQYTLVYSRSGYDRATIPDVRVLVGQKTGANARLAPRFTDMETYEVVAMQFDQQMIDLLGARSDAVGVMDSIGSDFFSRAGAGDAGEIMTKVTGASVVGGKYVFIRGLGERYSNTMMNGAIVPSADPDKRSVQMDIIPSDVVERIDTYKSFTPDLPGNFSGGLVDVITKTFPENYQLDISTSLGFNNKASLLDNFLTYDGGGVDWRFSDTEHRLIPKNWKDSSSPSRPFLQDTQRFMNPNDYSDVAARLQSWSRDFHPTMSTKKGKSQLDYGFSGTTGDSVDYNDMKFGYLVSANYETDYSAYDDGFVGRYQYNGQKDSLDPKMELMDVKGVHEVSFSTLANFAWEVSDKTTMSYNFLNSQAAEDEARHLSGELQEQFGLDSDTIYETYVLHYTERSLQNHQFKGRQVFSGLGDLESNWVTSWAKTTQDEPDLRFFTFDHDADGSNVQIRESLYSPPTRFYRELIEYNKNLRLDNTLPVDVGWTDNPMKIKFGWFKSESERTYADRRFAYKSNYYPSYGRDFSQTGDPAVFLKPENIVSEPKGSSAYKFTKYVEEFDSYGYDGLSDISAKYLMLEFPFAYPELNWFKGLKYIGGVRQESSMLEVNSKLTKPRTMARPPSYYPDFLQETRPFPGTVVEVQETPSSVVNEITLPSHSLVFEIRDNLTLRLSHGVTIARPTYKEIANVPAYEFVRGETLIGNPALSSTTIQNLDARIDWFPSPGEVFSASLFKKELGDSSDPSDGPIERIIKSVNKQTQFVNQDYAEMIGFELEARKNLSEYHPYLTGITVGANYTWLESEISVGALESDLDGGGTRPLAGQSPYLFNFDVTYNNPYWGLTTSLFYNIYGERLDSVSLSTGKNSKGLNTGPPNIYEQPVGTLDFTLSKEFADHWKLKFSAKNLLDPAVEKTYSYKGENYIYSSYNRGQSYSLSFGYSY
tara:strand:+ start:907 stop:3885 length:2979 start_codon:yes stop_codon:yes gene_type:complete